MRTNLSYLAFVLGLSACGAPGYSNSESAFTPSEYHAASSASSEYKREVGGTGVYEGLYENPDAIRHYCGNGDGVTDIAAWKEACDRKLGRVYWARVRTQYKYADWQEVTDYCDLKPNECATAKGYDAAFRSAHISGAQRKNYAQAEQLEGQREARIEAQKKAERKFGEGLTCATLEMGTEGAAADCRGQRVVRCKAKMSVLGSTANWEEHCIETPRDRLPE